MLPDIKAFDRGMQSLGVWACNKVDSYTEEDKPFYKSQIAARAIFIIATETLALVGIAYHTLYIIGMAIPASVKLALGKIPGDTAEKLYTMIPYYMSWSRTYYNHIEPLRDCVWYGVAAPVVTALNYNNCLEAWLPPKALFPEGKPLPLPLPPPVPPTLYQRARPWLREAYELGFITALFGAFVVVGGAFGYQAGRRSKYYQD